MTDEKTILKGTFWVYSAQAASLIAALLSTVLLSRMLDREGWGVFATVLSVSSFLSVLIDLGFAYTIIHYTSDLSTKNQYSKLKRYIDILLKYRFILMAILAAGIFLLSGWLSDFFHIPGAIGYFQVSALFFIFSNAFATFDCVIVGLKRFKTSSIFYFVGYALRLSFALLFVYLGFGVTGAILGYSVSYIFLTFFAIYVLKDLLFRSLPKEEQIIDKTADMFAFGGMLGIAQFASSFVIWTDSIMIGTMMGATYVGVYRIAMTISSALGGAIGAINKVVFPILTSIEARKEESTTDLNKVLRYGSFFAIPAVFGLAVLSTEIISIFFGVQYIDAAPVLALLSYMCFDMFFVGTLISYFSAKNNVKLIAYSAIVCALGNIILNFLLIPVLGIMGAAIASVSTRLLNLGILLFEGKRKIGLEVSFDNFKNPLLGSILMVLVIFLVKSLVIIDNIISIGILAVFGGLIYIAFEALLGFNVLSFGTKAMKLLLEK